MFPRYCMDSDKLGMTHCCATRHERVTLCDVSIDESSPINELISAEIIKSICS